MNPKLELSQVGLCKNTVYAKKVTSDGRFLNEKTSLQGPKIGKCFLSRHKTFKVCVIFMISLLNQFSQLCFHIRGFLRDYSAAS